MFTSARQSLFAIALVALVSAPLTAPAQTAAPTTLEPGDVIRVSVYGQPDLTTIARVGESGEITFPLLGSVGLEGMSPSQAERHISELLDTRGIVRNAQVAVFLERRSEQNTEHVTILGKVSRPGKYPLGGESSEGVTSVVDLLASAGGATDAAAEKIYLMRSSGEDYVRSEIDLDSLIQLGDLSMDQSLVDGDIVLVPEAAVFYIYGQVKRPGRYMLGRDMTVMQALSVASGVTDIGNEDGIVLRRGMDSGKSENEVDITTVLQPNDVIYVKARRF